ncbi:hypothetical protein [Mesorhizobium sp. dw_380]|nr:hypothetical protein [Mesorhizobium sp. dw_380]
MHFVIVVSRWALLGISAVDCVFGQNKKAAGQAARVPSIRDRVLT